MKRSWGLVAGVLLLLPGCLELALVGAVAKELDDDVPPADCTERQGFYPTDVVVPLPALTFELEPEGAVFTQRLAPVLTRLPETYEQLRSALLLNVHVSYPGLTDEESAQRERPPIRVTAFETDNPDNEQITDLESFGRAAQWLPSLSTELPEEQLLGVAPTMRIVIERVDAAEFPAVQIEISGSWTLVVDDCDRETPPPSASVSWEPVE